MSRKDGDQIAVGLGKLSSEKMVPTLVRQSDNRGVLNALLPAALVVMYLVLMLFLAAAPSAVMHKGLWRGHRTGTGVVWFESDLGRVGFSHANALVVQLMQQPERHVPVADIQAIRFSYQRLATREALEAMGVDLRLRRHWPRQLDRYDVAVVTPTGDVPVFLAGQVFVVLPLGSGLVDRAVDLLEMFGVVPDVEAHARAVVEELLGEFARRGHPVTLA